MNKVILTGRLTRDPEIRVSGEKQHARFSLAVRRPYRKDETDFLDCVAFNQQAEVAQKYLYKGSFIGVVGRIEKSSYQNKDGNTVYQTTIIVDEIEFLSTKNNNNNNNNDNNNNNNNNDNNNNNNYYGGY